MPNIISVLNGDGKTNLARETRSGVDQPNVIFDMEYNDQGGTGIVELVIRNQDTNNYVINMRVTSTTPPTDSGTGEVLLQEWDYQPIDGSDWNNLWDTEILVTNIPPGKFVKIRSRLTAPAGSNPVSHRGDVKIEYLRSSG